MTDSYFFSAVCITDAYNQLYLLRLQTTKVFSFRTRGIFPFAQFLAETKVESHHLVTDRNST